MADVIEWPGITTLDLPAARILDRAKSANLSTAVVMGWKPDGSLYFASTVADGGDVLWLMATCKNALLKIGDPQHG